MFSSSKGEAAIFLLSVCIFTETSSLLYNELRSLGVSCYPRDSCQSRDTDPAQENVRERNTCECDARCYKRGSCCIDSPYVDPRQSTRNEVCDGERLIGVGRYYYFNDTGETSFFQVPKCHPLWNGPVEIKKLCEMREPVEGTDFMVAIPVTNINSGVSYKNYFCAICNDAIEGSVLWDIGIYEGYESLISDRFNVQAVDDDFAENSGTCDGSQPLTLVYNEEERSYGYWDYCQNSSPRFVSLTVTLSIPEDIEPYVKGCRSNVVSHCLPNWTDLRARIKCGAYLGIIKAPESSEEGQGVRQYFRNVHCALCNNVTNFEGYSCEPFSTGALITTPSYATSITVLFGHLLSRNGCLGNENFLMGLGCRAVLCANPRHKVKNGKCSPP